MRIANSSRPFASSPRRLAIRPASSVASDVGIRASLRAGARTWQPAAAVCQNAGHDCRSPRRRRARPRGRGRPSPARRSRRRPRPRRSRARGEEPLGPIDIAAWAAGVAGSRDRARDRRRLRALDGRHRLTRARGAGRARRQRPAGRLGGAGAGPACARPAATRAESRCDERRSPIVAAAATSASPRSAIALPATIRLRTRRVGSRRRDAVMQPQQRPDRTAARARQHAAAHASAAGAGRGRQRPGGPA